jgi:hypothetical protein
LRDETAESIKGRLEKAASFSIDQVMEGLTSAAHEAG